MSTADIDENTLRLMRRMTAPPASHDRFVGDAVDMAAVDGLALGDLWTLAHATKTHEDRYPIRSLAAETALAILALRDCREPIFRGSACRDYLDHLAKEAEAEPEAERGSFDLSWPLQRACFCLNRCVELSFEGLGPSAKRLLAATPWRVMPHLAVALARLVDADAVTRVIGKLADELAASPLLIDELRAVAELDLAAHLIVADVACPSPGEGASLVAKTRDRLSPIAGYRAFAKAGLTKAVERVRQIHDLERPYAADKAFTLKESAIVARLAAVALDRDEPWLPIVLNELFLKVSIAPTAAKTVPSQSIAIALGHAIQAFSTPEAISTLRSVLRSVRHAGVKGKLQRNVRGAEAGLADRPEVALPILSDQPMSKAELGTLTRCLEAGLATEVSLPVDDWRAGLALHPQAGVLVRSLVWRVSEGSHGRTAVLPVLERGQLVLRGLSGAVVEPGIGARVMLWHPSNAEALERGAWRDRMVALRIKQPFKQVFREHYVVPAHDLANGEITMFSDHEVSIRTFLGVARREGWRLEYDQLARTIGDRTATIDLSHHIFPGAEGWVKILRVQVCTSGRRRYVPVLFGDISPVTLSEVLRSVDLLVSTSGFAISPDEEKMDDLRDTRLRRLALLPLGRMAEMRRDALARALAGRAGMEDMTFDTHHLRLGRYAIHLATGRVTYDGDPVTIDMPERPRISAVPWLPYDERLLETIAVTALQIEQLGRTTLHSHSIVPGGFDVTS